MTSSGTRQRGASRAMPAEPHSWPVYFCLLLTPLLLLPWGLSRHFWQSRPWMAWYGPSVNESVRAPSPFALWFLLVFAIFSAIAGKQPHYLVPPVPPLLLVIGYFLSGCGWSESATRRSRRLPSSAWDRRLRSEHISHATISHHWPSSSRPVRRRTGLSSVRGIKARSRSWQSFPAPFRSSPGDAEAWLEAHPKGFLLIRRKASMRHRAKSYSVNNQAEAFFAGSQGAAR